MPPKVGRRDRLGLGGVRWRGKVLDEARWAMLSDALPAGSIVGHMKGLQDLLDKDDAKYINQVCCEGGRRVSLRCALWRVGMSSLPAPCVRVFTPATSLFPGDAGVLCGHLRSAPEAAEQAQRGDDFQVRGSDHEPAQRAVTRAFLFLPVQARRCVALPASHCADRRAPAKAHVLLA